MLLEPQAIFKENVKDVVADGFTTADKMLHQRGAEEGLRRERRQRMSQTPSRDSSAPRCCPCAGSTRASARCTSCAAWTSTSGRVR